jgi:hypothetical protein
MGLHKGIHSLLNKQRLLIRHQEADDYPPPVYYEIDPKQIDNVRKDLEKDSTARDDPYNQFRAVLHDVLSEPNLELQTNWLMTLIEEWSYLLKGFGGEAEIAAICAAYGDEKTSQQILNHAKRNFSKTADCLTEAAKGEAATVLIALGETAGDPRIEGILGRTKRYPKYSRYPGRKRILREVGAIETPRAEHIKNRTAIKMRIYWDRLHTLKEGNRTLAKNPRIAELAAAKLAGVVTERILDLALQNIKVGRQQFLNSE